MATGCKPSRALAPDGGAPSGKRHHRGRIFVVLASIGVLAMAVVGYWYSAKRSESAQTARPSARSAIPVSIAAANRQNIPIYLTGLGTVQASLIIPSETLEALKKPFVRGSSVGAGGGLGLAIVDSVMRQIGGSLTLISPAMGRASGFEARLAFPEAGAPSHQPV